MPYSRDQMVTEAQRSGFPRVSARLVSDWASQGLLAHPTRVVRPAGQGRGARYVWSEQQKELFLSELHHRPGGKDIQRLLNIPVAIWVYWGDQWDVQLPQVRLALQTWATGEYNRGTTEDRAVAQARLAVKTLAAPNASGDTKRQLREALVGAVRGRRWDQDRIAPLAMAVADPSRRGRTVGPFATPAETLVHFLNSFLAGLTALPGATDDMLLTARDQQRDLTIGYARDWLQNATDPTFGGIFEQPTVQFFVNNACRDLIRLLGLITIVGDGPTTLGGWTNLPQVLRTHVHAPMQQEG